MEAASKTDPVNTAAPSAISKRFALKRKDLT